MARPHRQRKAGAQRKRRRPTRSSGRESPLSRFAAPWARWAADHCCDDPTHVRPPWSHVREPLELITSLLAVHGNPGTTAWEPDALLDMLDEVETQFGHEQMLALAALAGMFLDMLVACDLWTGSTEALEECFSCVDDEVDGGIPVPPDVADRDQEQALLHLPVVSQLQRLVEWVGTGRPITSTGAVRLADLPEVAAIFGLSVTTGGERRPSLVDDPDLQSPDRANALRQAMRETRASVDDVPRRARHLRLISRDGQHVDARAAAPGDAPAPPPTQPVPDPVPVRSMWDVDRIAIAWIALKRCGVIEPLSTRIRPGAEAHNWPTDGTTPPLRCLVSVVACYLVTWFESRIDEQVPERAMAGSIVEIVLRASIEGQPVNRSKVDELIGMVARPEGSPAGMFLASWVFNDLLDLCDLGFLSDGEAGFTIPLAFQPTVATAIAVMELSEGFSAPS